MEKKKLCILLAYVLAGILFVVNIKMFFDVIKIKEELSSVNMNISRLNNDINNIQSNVASTMNQIKESNTWLYNVDYKITNVSKDLKDVAITLKWSVRDLNKDYKMYLLYGEKDEKTGEVNKWNEVTSEDLGNLNYKKEIKLTYGKDYGFKIAAKNDNNTISEKLTDIDLLSQLRNRISINANPTQKSSSDNNVNLSFNVHVENRYNLSFSKTPIDFDENLLKIKDIKVKIYSDNNLKKEIHLMKGGKLLEEKARYDEPFKSQKDIKFETINFDGNIKYNSVKDSSEEIEIIVEDNLGRSYIYRSHGI